MVDFHTHILPGVDDGSKTAQESLKMLQLEQKMGVETIVLTPHFYSEENNPSCFLQRRAEGWERLQEVLKPGMPRLLLGAEVQYFEGIGHAEGIADLCIEDTNVLLLEMPFCHWDKRIIRTVLELNDHSGMQIVLAHIERYRSDQPKDTWKMLRDNGILAQVNASFFKGFFNKRAAVSMMRAGLVQFIGTDSHNMDRRKPNWDLVPEDMKAMAARNARELLFPEHK